MPAETDSQQPSAATDLGGREKTCVSREEGLLAPILESSDDAIMGQTLEGTILVWNAAAEKLYGYSAAEAVGQRVSSIVVPPERQEEIAQILERIRRGERVDHHETVRLRRDGTRLDVSLTVSPIRNATGEIIGASSIGRDISERKRAEAALAESEKMLRGLFEFAPDAIVVLDCEGRILRVNAQAERVFGYQRDEMVGQSVEVLIPRRLRNRHTEHRASYMAAPHMRPMGASLELYALRKDGTEVAVDIMLSPIQAGIVIAVVRDITERKRAEEMRAAMAGEREIFAKQRAAELAKANEALRGCLDALASVPELDDFLGQVMTAITRQLDAVSSTLRMLNREQNTLALELLFQDGRIMSAAEANYPESSRSLSPDEQPVTTFLDQPTTVIHILDPHSPIAEAHRSYLLELSVKTLLIIPLSSGGQVNGRLDFRFNEERNFDAEELEIVRALATQASLAIQLTRLAKTARQSAVLEERNRLAGEIHDTLAQSFAGISMQLELAQEEMAATEGGSIGYIQHAYETAKFGLAEARRSVHSLRSSALRESGFVTALQRLVERSNVAGRVRCDFRSDNIPEESLPATVQHQLLRIAQEAISNAIRHAKPTVVTLKLRWDTPNLILQVKDNGSGISSALLEKSDGVGMGSMRDRAAQIGARLEIQTATGRGTSIIVTAPIRALQA